MRTWTKTLTKQEQRQHRDGDHAFRSPVRAANQRQAEQCRKLARITRQ